MHQEVEALEARDSNARRIAWGAAMWIAFCALAVALRGVRWDESYEDALIFLRQIVYPLDHPTYIFLHDSFSLQTFAAVALWRLFPNALFFNGLHNVLFVAAAVLPAYFLGALLTRRALAGHIAAVFILLYVHVSFNSVYPLFVWPGVFSYGQIGTGWALLTLCALLAKRPRTAGLMLGLLPSIHAGQFPQLLPLAGCILALYAYRRDRRTVLHFVSWGFVGLALTAAFGLIVYAFSVPFPTSGPYAVNSSQPDAWRTFVAYYDPHRRLPLGPNDGNGHLGVMLAVLLSVGAAVSDWQRNRRLGAFAGLAVYTVTIALIVYSIMGVQAWLGPDTPFLLTSWIPYRLINHGALIVVPLTVALLFGGVDDCARVGGRAIVALILIFELVKPLAALILPHGLYTRYVYPGDGVFFALCGAAYAMLLRAFDSGRARYVYAVFGGVALVIASVLHHFGAVCAVTAFGLTWYLTGPARASDNGKQTPMWLAKPTVAGWCCVLLLTTLTFHEWRQRKTLPISAFDRAVTRYLAERDQPTALLLGQPGALIFPTRTGHASVGDADAIKMVYLRSVFPAVIRIYADLYGIHYDQPPRTPRPPTWRQVWAARTPEEWQALSRKYGFAYVCAPADLGLQLVPVLEAGRGTLYQVPPDGPSLAPILPSR